MISGRLSLNQAELARDLLQGSHQRAGRKLAPGVCDGDPLLLGLWLIIERACASIHARGSPKASASARRALRRLAVAVA